MILAAVVLLAQLASPMTSIRPVLAFPEPDSLPYDPASPHADALEIACDASCALESIELRATCSEGVLGLVGMTVLTP